MAEFTARANGMRLLSTSWNRNVILNAQTSWGPWILGEATANSAYGEGLSRSRYSSDRSNASAKNFYATNQKQNKISFNTLESILIEGDSPSKQAPSWIAVETYTGNFSTTKKLDEYNGAVQTISREERSEGVINNSWSAKGSWDLKELQQSQGTSLAYHRVLTAGRDIITGGEFGDTMHAGLSNDQLFGNEGSDYLIGGAGNDRVYGGPGDDQIFDSEGINYLEGGPGADRFYAWTTGSNGYWVDKKPKTFWKTRTIKTNEPGNKPRKQYFVDDNVDIITDFNVDEDLLYISQSSAFRVTPAGVQIWNSNERNLVAFLAGMDDYQFLHQVRALPWPTP